MFAASGAPPKILRIWLSSTDVRGGDVVHAFVQTTSNVASVEVRLQQQSVSMARERIGTFNLDYQVPRLPFFFHGRHDVAFIARNAKGNAVVANRTITLH